MRRTFEFMIAVACAFVLPTVATADDFECRGAMTGVIPGNLVVPEGQACECNNCHVQGNVILQAHAVLTAQDLTVEGNVEGVGDCTALITAGGRIKDVDIPGEGSTTQLTQVIVNGNVETEGNVTISDSTVAGNLVSKCAAGRSCNFVTGNTTVSGNGEWKAAPESSVNATVVDSRFASAHWEGFGRLQVVRSSTDGPMTVEMIMLSFAGFLEVHAGTLTVTGVTENPAGSLSVERSTIENDFEATNLRDVTFLGNNVGEKAEFKHNDAIVVIGNTAKKFECTGNRSQTFTANDGEEEGCMTTHPR